MARRTLAPFRYWRWLRWSADRKVDAAMQRLLEVVHRLVSTARAPVSGDSCPGQPPSNLLEAICR